MKSKSSKKQLRQQAAAEEVGRRRREAERACPLSRGQLDALLDALAERFAREGNAEHFAYAREWLSENGHPVGPTLEFFAARRLTDDWAVLVSGDPHGLFGGTEFQSARMPIPRDALEALIDHVRARVSEAGCDRTQRFTREWLGREGWPVPPTAFALIALGGGCDCEVVLNVEPSHVFPPPA